MLRRGNRIKNIVSIRCIDSVRPFLIRLHHESGLDARRRRQACQGALGGADAVATVSDEGTQCLFA